MSSSARRWIAFSMAAILAFYIGHIHLHLSLEEHSHAPVENAGDSHSHHEHDAEHHSHPKADHSVVFLSKSKAPLLSLDFVIFETAALWEIPVGLPVSILEEFEIQGKSPPNRFTARGPPSV